MENRTNINNIWGFTDDKKNTHSCLPNGIGIRILEQESPITESESDEAGTMPVSVITYCL